MRTNRIIVLIKICDLMGNSSDALLFLEKLYEEAGMIITHPTMQYGQMIMAANPYLVTEWMPSSFANSDISKQTEDPFTLMAYCYRDAALRIRRAVYICYRVVRDGFLSDSMRLGTLFSLMTEKQFDGTERFDNLHIEFPGLSLDAVSDLVALAVSSGGFSDFERALFKDPSDGIPPLEVA